MSLISFCVDFVLHLDTNLAQLADTYGVWMYAILFVIVFCETGLVATPFLPGDSLLFAAGAVASTGALDPRLLVLLLLLAPLAGDNANYWIGHFIGPKVFSRPKSLLFNPEHLNRTHHFYEKYGGKTVIIARFLPIVRTFAPFVAGIGRMRYLRFLAFSVIGAILWVPTLVYAGFFFSKLPFVRHNFTLVIFAIIILSLMPTAIELLRHKLGQRTHGPA